jgi:alkylation response protein AidB-like acyl-CoA dehydrogenase
MGRDRRSECWRLAVELGWPGVAVPAEHGGLGLGVAAQAAIIEEAGYAMFSAPLLSTAQASAALTRLSGGAVDEALAAIAAGVPATLAFGSADRICRRVPDAECAELIVVLAGERSTVLRPGRGVQVSTAPGPDAGRPLFTITWSPGAGSALSGDDGEALAAARSLAAAELIGVAQRALDGAVAHAREREQFGRAIGSFQGVKHLLADLYVALEGSRSLVEEAAARLDDPRGGEDASLAAAMAKAAASEAAVRAVKGAIQVTGALGITAEHELPWLLRRARVGAQLLGDARRLYGRLGAAQPPAPAPVESAVVAEYRAWLDSFLPADYDERTSDYRRDIGLRRRHQAAAFEAGWLVPQWPRTMGGRGLGPMETVAVALERARRQAPRLPNIQSVGVVAPALARYATDAQRDRYLVPTLRGELTWGLGMSEPGAGSDLAAMRTRAVRHGESFVVSGQKIWTTQAHTSDLLMLFCRTDPDAPRHRGLSCLLVDLDTPGISVREIETGWPDTEEFCEVFLDDVVVPAERMLGPLNAGWTVAMESLNHERDMIWVNAFVDIERGLQQIARSRGGDRCGLEIERGRLATVAAALRLTGMRALSDTVAGRPAPHFHILKLLGTETVKQVWELAIAVAGADALEAPDLLREDFDALGGTISGGTSEIQRNIIGERVLGLPRG